jgi:hypothetical protein
MAAILRGANVRAREVDGARFPRIACAKRLTFAPDSTQLVANPAASLGPLRPMGAAMRRTIRSQRVSPIVRQLTVLVASVCAAASAAAAPQTYQLSLGVWGRGDGYEVDVPFLGKKLNNCNFLKFGLNTTRPTGSFLTKAIGMAPKDFPGFMTHQALPYGCPSGMGNKIVATAPGKGGAFTLPGSALSRPGLMYLVAFPLPANPTLVQAATSGTWKIPFPTRGGMGTQGGRIDQIGATTVNGARIGGSMRTRAGMASAACTDLGGANQCNNLPPFRKFLKSAWKGGPMSTFKGQTGRVGPDFTWCWGAPGCTTFNGGGATQGLMVRYKAGPQRFGGTSNQLVNTGIVGSLFLDLGFSVEVNLLDSGMGAIQVEGRGYADLITDNLTPAKTAFSMVMVAPVYQMALHTSMDPIGSPKLSLITMVTGPHPPFVFNFPQQNIKFGFPLTTGTVIARDTNPPALGAPVVTLTAMGGDTVTAMGARNISLVTGALSRLSVLGVRTSGVSHMFLPEPGHTSQLLAGVAALFGVAFWRARRSRA